MLSFKNQSDKFTFLNDMVSSLISTTEDTGQFGFLEHIKASSQSEMEVLA